MSWLLVYRQVLLSHVHSLCWILDLDHSLGAYSGLLASAIVWSECYTRSGIVGLSVLLAPLAIFLWVYPFVAPLAILLAWCTGFKGSLVFGTFMWCFLLLVVLRVVGCLVLRVLQLPWTFLCCLSFLSSLVCCIAFALPGVLNLYGVLGGADYNALGEPSGWFQQLCSRSSDKNSLALLKRSFTQVVAQTSAFLRWTSWEDWNLVPTFPLLHYC